MCGSFRLQPLFPSAEHFADYRVLRTATKRRMARNLAGGPNDARIEFYRGLLAHGNAEKLRASLGQ